ncbi:MAG: methylcobamide--CoM methyltransferase [Clostridiaceae bacterium]|nr:methylcobamide--CoM methyltransferase [Clostridiaceae bacterium]MBW4860772.1 methylcobamide--CoM methyltransferase [Clostridiaceae bacterium]MBW4868974.1 methylcobamide--CoM methyltransferase [Clostridiaceae bacterium]
MSEIMDFKCISDKMEEIPGDIVKKTGLSFPEVHTKAEYIATLSKELKEYKKDNLCRVPFCNTVEAEALGGNIKLGDAKAGPRVESYAFNSIDELMEIEEIDLNRKRINEVLKAVEILHSQGETVVLNVEGPFTIITSLVDSRIFYKAIRKNKKMIYEILNVMEDSIIKYIKEGINRGANIISYGDPVGSLDIVGPRVYKEFSGRATYNILKCMESELDGSIMHICGKTSAVFQNMGYIKSYPIKFESKITYGQAIDHVLENKKDIRIIGHNCIKRTALELKGSTLWSIEFL